MPSRLWRGYQSIKMASNAYSIPNSAQWTYNWKFLFPHNVSILYFKALICINYYCVSLNKNWLDLTSLVRKRPLHGHTNIQWQFTLVYFRPRPHHHHHHHLKKDIFFLLLFIILLFSLPSPKINKLPDSSGYKTSSVWPEGYCWVVE